MNETSMMQRKDRWRVIHMSLVPNIDKVIAHAAGNGKAAL